MPYKTKEERAKRDSARRAENVRFIRQYKLEKGCADCGYKEHHAGLQFDHMPGFVKLYNIAALLGRNKKTIMSEINKCEVVCSTCHSIRTFERRQQGNAKDIV